MHWVGPPRPGTSQDARGNLTSVLAPGCGQVRCQQQRVLLVSHGHGFSSAGFVHGQ